MGVGLLLGVGGTSTPLQLPQQLTMPRGLALLVLLILVRGGVRALIAIHQERLRSGFTDRLRRPAWPVDGRYRP